MNGSMVGLILCIAIDGYSRCCYGKSSCAPHDLEGDSPLLHLARVSFCTGAAIAGSIHVQ